MKKIYQKPETGIVNVQTVQMIAGSVDMFNENASSEGLAREIDDFIYVDDDF